MVSTKADEKDHLSVQLSDIMTVERWVPRKELMMAERRVEQSDRWMAEMKAVDLVERKAPDWALMMAA